MHDASDAVDPAARFYRRNRVRHAALEAQPRQTLREAIREPGHRYAAVWGFLRDHPGLRVLEIGYGGHDAVECLAPQTAEYHFADIIDRTGAAPLPANAYGHVANLDNRFPFADASFDAIVAMMVIEHLYDPFHAFAEIARVARPGARLFVNLPNIAALRCRLALLAGRMPVTSRQGWFEDREWDGGHLHAFTVADVRRLAALSGLAVEAVLPAGRWLGLKRLRPSLLCHEITYVLRRAQAGARFADRASV